MFRYFCNICGLFSHYGYHLITLVLLAGLSTLHCTAQGFYTDFGKNRVQYNDFEWQYYEAPNCVTYFYQGGRDLAKFTVQLAEEILPEIETKLEFRNSSKFEIMVYHNLSDLKQSNIGMDLELNNTGGVTKIIGNKIFIHFNGDYKQLERDIREGLTRVCIEKMIFGVNIQEILQNAVLLNLPDWYVNGLVSYVGQEWSPDLDQQLKAAILKGELEKFNRLTGEQATFAGHALWHYLNQAYGEATIPNILYLTRINRSVEGGFLFVLGNTTANVIEEFNDYYYKLYTKENEQFNLLNDDLTVFTSGKRVKRRNLQLDELKVSPSGKYFAYTTSEIGKHIVYLYDMENDKKSVVLRTGSKSFTDGFNDNYPLLAWNKTGDELVVVYEKRDQIKLLQYKIKDKSKTVSDINKFQQVVDVAFANNREKLLMSAVRNGQVDIYIYHIPSTRTSQITKDPYSDLAPRYVKTNEQEGIIFASNRINDTLRTETLNDTLPLANYDIYFYPLNSSKSGINDVVLVQITNTPLTNEQLPLQYDETYISYLSDENGINNRYVGYFDSIFIRTDTKVFFRDSTVLNPVYALDSANVAALIDTIIYQDIYKTTAITFPVSNNAWSINESDIALKSKEAFNLYYTNRRYIIQKELLADNPKAEQQSLTPTNYRTQFEYATQEKKNKKKEINNAIELLKQQIQEREDSVSKAVRQQLEEATVILPPTFDPLPAAKPATDTTKTNNSTEIDIDNYTFGSETGKVAPASTDSTVIANNSKPLPTLLQPNEAYYFQSEFDFMESNPSENSGILVTDKNGTNILLPTLNNQQKKEDEPLFNRAKIRQYFVAFDINHVVTQLDNTIIFTPYENFSFSPVTFNNTNLNGLIKLGISDLMEDHRLVGGFRLPIALNGSEYFIEYQNLKKRLDKKILLYRRSQRNTYTIPGVPNSPDFNLQARNITNLAQYRLSYPFDVNTSLRGHVGWRQDRIVFLATDPISLEVPGDYENWFFTKIEFVFDNTFQPAMNILEGMRYKFYAEFHKPFDGAINDQEFSLNFKNTGWLGIAGWDVRHYQKIHKQIIWANRVSGAVSFGPTLMAYFLGGVDNWLVFDTERQFDFNTPVDETANYAFKALATNLRGFRQNVRNGSSNLVINSEIRIPIFSYLSPAPLRSELLKNFQIVPFFDVGTAWQGINPFNEENQFNTIEIGEAPIEATIQYFRNPVVFGYGAGLRTKLLGYFVRLDIARGVDSGDVEDMRLHFSLGLDF